MSFEESVATQPFWVQMWHNWLGFIIVASCLCLAFSKTTRRDALIILVTSVMVILSMGWIFDKLGFVRLLGIVHVFLWTPLAIYFWKRLKNPQITRPFRQVIWLFLATIVISLAFDYIDVIRYVLGQRASIVP